MPRELDFGPPEHTATEGIRFRLWGEGWEEWFTTVPEAPSGVLGDLQVGIQYDEQRRAVYRAPNLIRFMVNVLREHRAVVPIDGAPEGAELVYVREARGRRLQVESEDGTLASDTGDDEKAYIATTDDVVRFYDLVNDKTRIVPVDQLGRAVKGLSEAFANRPTQPSGQ